MKTHKLTANTPCNNFGARHIGFEAGGASMRRPDKDLKILSPNFRFPDTRRLMAIALCTTAK
jgi:hypothetical protein